MIICPVEIQKLLVRQLRDHIRITAGFIGVRSVREQRILDHSSGEISTEDAAILLRDVCQELKNENCSFYVGTSYRHCLVWENGKNLELTPPHDVLTQRVGNYLPEDEMLLSMQKKSYEILKAHPLNRKRKEQGLNPANSFWFWGAGTKPILTSFEKIYHKKGVMISAVDLLKGNCSGSRNGLQDRGRSKRRASYQL